jgi:hypothetical protein
MDAVKVGTIASPVNATGEPSTATPAVMVTVPAGYGLVRFAGEVGLNTRVMVQFAPAAKVVLQVPPNLEYGAVTVTVMPVSPVAVGLVSVSV